MPCLRCDIVLQPACMHPVAHAVMRQGARSANISTAMLVWGVTLCVQRRRLDGATSCSCLHLGFQGVNITPEAEPCVLPTRDQRAAMKQDASGLHSVRKLHALAMSVYLPIPKTHEHHIGQDAMHFRQHIVRIGQLMHEKRCKRTVLWHGGLLDATKGHAAKRQFDVAISKCCASAQCVGGHDMSSSH